MLEKINNRKKRFWMGVDQWVNCKYTSLRVPVGILRVCIIKMDMVELPLNPSIYRHRQKIPVH